MLTIFCKRTREIIANKAELERALNVKIDATKKNVIIDGAAVDEYEASIILDAISFGFSAKRALLLLNPENIFRKIRIKSFTRRTLESARSRLIGSEGKTRRTIEDVGDCEIVIGDSEVGVIGAAESIEKTTTAITNLIRGSKQANVYNFLEKMNAIKKKQNKEIGTFKNIKKVDDDGEAE